MCFSVKHLIFTINNTIGRKPLKLFLFSKILERNQNSSESGLSRYGQCNYLKQRKREGQEMKLLIYTILMGILFTFNTSFAEDFSPEGTPEGYVIRTHPVTGESFNFLADAEGVLRMVGPVGDMSPDGDAPGDIGPLVTEAEIAYGKKLEAAINSASALNCNSETDVTYKLSFSRARSVYQTLLGARSLASNNPIITIDDEDDRRIISAMTRLNRVCPGVAGYRTDGNDEPSGAPDDGFRETTAGYQANISILEQ